MDNFSILPEQKNILISFVTGEDAVYSETLDDECLVNLIYDILKKCFQKLNISAPTQIIR